MAGVGVSARVAPEAWERIGDDVRSRLASFLDSRPGLAQTLRRVRAWALWVALAWVLVMVVVFPKYRSGVWTYACCFWILIAWFAVARTKTITWGGLARMFSVGVVWSWVIAFVSYRLSAAAGAADITAAGPGTAIAAFTEESFKLVPLAALAVVAPGRVRRFAAVDWLLLGLALGLGFQAWEDLARRVGQDVRPKGLLDLILENSRGAPEYGWGLLSGGSSVTRAGDIYGYAGHHVFTGLVAGAVGLGVACWRRPPLRVVALLLPVVAFFICVTDHFAYNAALHDPTWTDAPHESAPWLIRTAWPLLGHGTGKGWLLLLVLLACLLVDARRLRAAGPLTDLDVPGWTGQTRLLSERLAPTVRDRLTGSSARLVTPVQAVVDLAVFAGRDLSVLLTAHLRDGEEPRRAALLRGRAAGVMLRQVRAEAIASHLLPAAGERRGRRAGRAVAVLSLVVLLLLGTVYAVVLARHIGTDLTPANWLAGQFDGLAQWWHSLSPLQKLLAGAGVAALIALSGGSLGLALGVSGAFTYVAEHGAGAADFTRDPVAATRSWLATTTPAGALLDLAEFGLTFAPGNFAGAAAGRGIRSVAREYADDPAAFWAHRRAALAVDRERGAWELPFGRGSVERNQLEQHEFEQAQDIVRYRGGEFVGAPTSNFPGIDGWIDGVPVQLKKYDGTSPSAVLKRVSQAEAKAAGAGYEGVDVYISAVNVSRERLLDFGANGPLPQIPSQGVIKIIYVRTSDGWIMIPGDIP